MKNKVNNYNTTVVSISNYSFNYLLKNLEYSFPGSLEERKIFDYIAFYRTKPISAITHYGKVKKIIENAEIDGRYKLLNFGDRVMENGTKVLFEKIIELKSYVESNDGNAIQGKYYTKLHYIKNEKTISDLWEINS